MKKATLLFGFVLAAGAFLLAKKFWEEKPYLEWNHDQAVSILLDSPWSQSQTFGQSQLSGARSPASPGEPSSPTSPESNTSGPVPRLGEIRSGDFSVSRQYYVRFQSASPVRMALARMAMLRGRVSEQQARQFVETAPFPGYIVVVVSLAPGQERTELDTVTTDLLKNSTYLLLKKSKQRVYLERYVSPQEANANEGIFLFPRAKNGEELVSVEEEEIRFISKLNPRTELNRRFKLRDMVLNGKLEI